MERVQSILSQDFYWLDETNVEDTYNNFANGEYDNPTGNENCGVFFTIGGQWRSEKCSVNRYYVCQIYSGNSGNVVLGIVLLYLFE